VIYIYGRDVIGANCNIVIVVVVKTFHFSVFRPREQRRPENGKMKCFQSLLQSTAITITTELKTVNHYDKIYCVFETLTNKKQYLLTISTNNIAVVTNFNILLSMAPMSDVTTIDINHIPRQ